MLWCKWSHNNINIFKHSFKIKNTNKIFLLEFQNYVLKHINIWLIQSSISSKTFVFFGILNFNRFCLSSEGKNIAACWCMNPFSVHYNHGSASSCSSLCSSQYARCKGWTSYNVYNGTWFDCYTGQPFQS